MKLIDLISLIKEEDNHPMSREKISAMKRFVANIHDCITFSDGTFPDNIQLNWLSDSSSRTRLPSNLMDRFMNQMVGVEPRANVDFDNEISSIVSMVKNSIEDVNSISILHINQLVYLMWKLGFAFVQTPQGDRFGVFGEVYVSMARFIGRLNCDVKGRNISPVPGDKKSIRLADYIAALLTMFDIQVDVGTVMEYIKLRQEDNNFRYVLVDSGGIKNAYTECVFKSCMNNDGSNQGKESLDYYDAMPNIKLLVGYKGAKAYSRAILWGLRDGTYLVDRVYDYNGTMNMEDYIDDAIRSEKKTLNVFNSGGDVVEIKLKDARAGSGQAGMVGWKLKPSKIYGVVCPIPNGIPNYNYSPYFDSVLGIYIPDKYGDKIVFLVGSLGGQTITTRNKIEHAGNSNKFLRVSGSTGAISNYYYLIGSDGNFVKDTSRLLRVNGSIVYKGDGIELCVSPNKRVGVYDKLKMQDINRYVRLFESKKFVEDAIGDIRVTDIKKNPVQAEDLIANINVYAHREMVITNEFTGCTILKEEACLLINPPMTPNRYVNIGISGYNGVMVMEEDVLKDDSNFVRLSEYHRATDDFYYNFSVYAPVKDVVKDKHGNAYLANCIEINSDGLPILKQKG